MKRPAIILICLLIQACSSTTKGLGHSLWNSVFGTPGVQLTEDEIQNMPYASQYVQLNGGRYATARSVFHWNGSDSVTLGNESTHVRILDEEITTDQTHWRNRYWVDEDGLIRQSEQYLGANWFPVRTTLIKAAKS